MHSAAPPTAGMGLSIAVFAFISTAMLWSMATIYHALASPHRLYLDPFEAPRPPLQGSLAELNLQGSRFWHDHDRVTVRHLPVPVEPASKHEEHEAHKHEGPISYSALNHVTVVVDNLEAAATFYTQALGFHPAYGFSRVRNGGEAKAAGVEVADAAVRVLHVPGIGLSIELLQLGTTKSVKRTPAAPRLWEPGAGVGHLSLKVKDVRAAYIHLRRWEGKGVSMLAHGPVHLDAADAAAVVLFREPERDTARRKAEMAFRMGRRSALFFRDPYGVTWALDQHD